MHAVKLVVLCLFILVCRSKSPTGLMLHVVQYSTQNQIYMSMAFRWRADSGPGLDAGWGIFVYVGAHILLSFYLLI